MITRYCIALLALTFIACGADQRDAGTTPHASTGGASMGGAFSDGGAGGALAYGDDEQPTPDDAPEVPVGVVEVPVTDVPNAWTLPDYTDYQGDCLALEYRNAVDACLADTGQAPIDRGDAEPTECDGMGGMSAHDDCRTNLECPDIWYFCYPGAPLTCDACPVPTAEMLACAAITDADDQADCYAEIN